MKLDESSPEGKKEISNKQTLEKDKNLREKIIKEQKLEQKLLKNKNVLVKIVEEVHKEGLVGEETSILTLINKIFLRLVKNYSPTSSNVLISDKTGSGKDIIASSVCNAILPENNYHHRTDISDKAFDYWQPITGWEEINGKKVPIKDSWDEHVIHLEDPRDDALTGQSFRVMASGGTHVTKVINLKPVTIEIDGKPVIIVTSLNATIDEEGQRRWDSLRIDTSEKLTEAVKKKILLRASGKNNNGKNELLRHAVKTLLSSHNVVIPFAEELEKYLPNTLIMRTQLKKLLDYIKSSAGLHQWQRERDEQGRLIATWFDYDYARFVFTILKDVEGITLNSAEEEFIVFLREQDEPISIRDAYVEFKIRSMAWIYDHLDSFVSKGLIEVSYEPDGYNRDIKKIRATKCCENFDLPSSLWFSTQVQKGLEKEQQKEFKSFQSFSQILKILDKNREKVGLTPIFSDWYDKPVENQENQETNTGSTEVNKTKIKNKKRKESEEKLQEKLLKLKNSIEDNKKAGYKIDDTFLSNNFGKKFIQHCKKQNLLIKNGEGEYDFHWR